MNPVGRATVWSSAKAPQRSSERDGPWVVGRDVELAALSRLQTAAFGEGPRAALIGGEAGVGKTSVVNAFVADATGAGSNAHVIRGNCVPLGGDGLPYAPVVGLVRELTDQFSAAAVLDWAGGGAAELRRIIPELGAPDEPAETGQNRLRLYETIVGLLEEAARQAPLIMVVEDLHWADTSSRNLIEFFLRAVSDVALLAVMTYRDDELTRRHPLRPFLAEVARLPAVERLEIGPLDSEPLTELITTVVRQEAAVDNTNHPIADTSIDPELIRHVMTVSAGIPYFAVELAACADCTTNMPLPPTLRDTVLLRISRVGTECQQLLQILALGDHHHVGHEVIAAVSQMPAQRLDDTLREAVEANLIIPDETGYRFRHALMQEVLADDLLPGERTRLHRAYAAALEDHPELLPEQVRALALAHHWYAARDNEHALRWTVQAARMQQHGFSEALQQYERALELWEAVPQAASIAGPIIELLDEAATAAANAGEPERSLTLLNDALARTHPDTDPLGTATRLSEKSRMLQNLLQPGMLDTIDQAISLVPAQPPTRLRADVLMMRASMLLPLQKPAAVAAAQEAIETAQAVDAPSLESDARNTLGVALVTLGLDVDEGLTQLRRAATLAPSSQLVELRYYINYSNTLVLLGQYRESLRVADQGRDVAARYGLVRRSGVIMAGNAAEAAMSIGDWGRARELVEWALRVSPRGDHWIHQRRLLAEIILWVDDDPDASEEILHDLHGFFQLKLNGPQYFFHIQRVEALAQLSRGNADTAWQTVADLMYDVPWFEPSQTLQAVTVAAMAYGRGSADQRARWDPQLRRWLDFNTGWPIMRQLKPLVESELDPSVDGWQTAITEMEAQHCPPHLIAYARLEQAKLQLRKGHRAEARASAAEAAKMAGQHGLGLLTRWLTEAGFGADRTSRAIESGLSVLTAREHDVLVLVADGLSNGQIAQRLVISSKTVSVHVSNILAKLGADSRGVAAAQYRRAGNT